MSLASGTRVGVYEIVSKLGAGGMGEVYRARDTRLGRDIAIKILPSTFAAERDRLARFEREARTLAAVNHPNIATIYGVEDSGGAPALVMELVEGPTLSERIAEGPLPLREALTIARQIADALEAAHEKGIIHRDLKPANVKLTSAGAVKVLDFGLAKVANADSVNQDLTRAPTVTACVSGEGVFVGTPAYMSPEQARGQVVDKRTDIWAFGCVLYEMLTGRAVFARSTASDTLAAILESEPKWDTLPPGTPLAVRRLLQRSLEKDTKRRFRDIADAAIEIEDAANGPAGSGESHSGAVVVTVAKWRNAAVALGAVALAAAGVAVWNGSRASDQPRTADAAAFAVHLQSGQQWPIDTGLPVVIAISPDGANIVYAARDIDGDRLYHRHRNELDASPIPGTEGAIGPFFSPDGKWLGFAAGGVLRAVSVDGGAPRTIAPAPNFGGGSWGPDDIIVYSPDWSSGLVRVSAHGGKSNPVTSDNEFHKAPHVLPDGKAALSSVQRDQVWMVAVVELATGRRQELFEGRNPVYTATGHIVFGRADALFAAPFDVGRLAVTGAAVQLIDGVRTDGNDSHFAIANDGTLVYVPEVSAESKLVWFDRQGNSRPLDAEPRRFSHPRISPDGSRVVVGVTRESGGNELWIYDAQRGAHAPLSPTGRVSRPVWTADGKGVTFQREGNLYTAPADDGSEPLLLLKRDDAQLVRERQDSLTSIFPLDWSSNSNVLVFSAPAPRTNRDVWTLRDGAATPFLSTPRDERAAMFSPDGRWIVYAAKETGRVEQIYVQPYPGPGGREVISRGGGIEPIWSPTGREIFFRSVDGTEVMTVDVRTEPSFWAGTPRVLFAGQFADLGGSYWSNYDVSPNGQSFLMLESDRPTTPRLNVVLNWVNAIQPR